MWQRRRLQLGKDKIIINEKDKTNMCHTTVHLPRLPHTSNNIKTKSKALSSSSTKDEDKLYFPDLPK